MIEPGRSLVARSCVTLYRVSTVKHTGRTFVAVDGGMADNLDVALTGQGFEAALATRMRAAPDEVVNLVGRQCESGDLLVPNLPLPGPQVGDLIAMPVTGAYTYTLGEQLQRRAQTAGGVLPRRTGPAGGDAGNSRARAGAAPARSGHGLVTVNRPRMWEYGVTGSAGR